MSYDSPPAPETIELYQTFLETVVYQDRTYQSYAINNLTYLVPIDEEETERLHNMHIVLSYIFEGRLIFPPIDRPNGVLDCGHGTASWAMEVAQLHPLCEVVGIDINPMGQPEEMPANLYLQVDDLNRSLSFPPHHFDLVNSRLIAQGIHVNRWTQYVRDLLRVLRPGGWCQMVEMHFNVQSDNGSLTLDHALRQWSARYVESMNGLKDLLAATRLPTLMREAGFVDIESRMIPLPTCAWSSGKNMFKILDAREYEIGAANRENVQRMLYSFAIFPFTERLGMSRPEAQVLIDQARAEADNPAYKAYFPLYVCIGRKRRSRR
ncbi:UMTA methyltransferase [Hyaloscypha finlandica]|nr:UMTA methyltransferase [Hyaloscypha finlandica]